MLKIDLNELKGQIQIFPKNWYNLYETNCYAYALGIDIREDDICSFAYQPGIISETIDLPNLDYFSYDDLIKAVESDLDVLDINYREIKPNDDTFDNEWKIALMVEYLDDNCSDSYLENFHFLRSNKNNIWIHKDSYLGQISKKDDSYNNITDPRSCDMCLYKYKKCYALSLNK